MDKLKMHTPDGTKENIDRIAESFPNCITETKNDKGVVTRTIDFDQLRQELSEQAVDGPRERYHLNWPGKREALLAANAPIARTLRPVPSESVAFETTRHLFIEGDNLEAMKLLQESYLNRIKIIYMDPPYNTGHDFLYNDDFKEDSAAYFRRSNQVDDAGSRMVANTDANGRFHSDWLTMMYPRLRLARTLLSPTGILCISIHDAEVANLKLMCDEVFGSQNFVGQVTWKARVKPVNIGEAKYRPQKEVEYVLLYQRQLTAGTFSPLFTGGVRTYPEDLNGRKYRLATILKSNRGVNFRSTMTFSLGDYTPPDGQRWQAGEDVIKQLNEDGYIEFRDGTPFKRYFEDEEGAEHDPFYCFMEGDWSSTSEAGKSELNRLVGNRHGFDTVKPVRLIRTLLEACTAPDQEQVVLDCFCGSGTTAQAVMEANAAGRILRYIMIQLPEPCDEDGEAFKAGFRTVADIGKQRIRRAGEAIREDAGLNGPRLDIGFRVFRVDTSNMKDVYYQPDAVTQETLHGLVDNIKEDRSDEDLLFQVLLDWGVYYGMTLPIKKELIAGKTVYLVDTNALVACFEPGIDEAFIKDLAKRKPLRAVFRDNGYGTDAAKINVEQIFKLLSPGTEVKSL